MKRPTKKAIHASSVSALSAILLLGTGCASIVHGGKRAVAVSSQPAGAKVTITNANTGATVYNGVTPLTVSLEPKRGFFKGQGYNLKFELPGYNTADMTVQAKLSGWYFGNIIFGGLIGILIVDPATGSMWNLSPDKIEQPLSSAQTSLIKSRNGFVVVLMAQTTEGERASMVRIN